MADFIVSDSGAAYSSIAAAYQAAAAQARATGQSQNVIVQFGEYEESFTMDTDGVNLISAQASTGIEPVINGTITVAFDSETFVSTQRTASIICFKIQKILLAGNNYQKLMVSDSEISNSAETPLVLDNSAISSSSLGYQPSSVSIVNSIIVSDTEAPAVEVANGYFVANRVTITGLSTSQSIVVTSTRTAPSIAQTGCNISNAQIIGQVKLQYDATPDYTTLILNKLNVTTSGTGFSPIFVENGRAKISYVVLSNPESQVLLYYNPESVVAYQNLSNPANAAAPPSQSIPRNRLSPDRVGGVVLNDQQGRLTSLVGTTYGQVLGWNPSASSWVAMPPPGSSASVIEVDETVIVGKLVAVSSLGLGTLADCTVTECYPAIGVCIALEGTSATIQDVGITGAFLGLLPRQTYFLGTDGNISTTIPEGAFVAQVICEGIDDTVAMLQMNRTLVYL